MSTAARPAVPRAALRSLWKVQSEGAQGHQRVSRGGGDGGRAELPGVLLAVREVTVTQPLQDLEVTEEGCACFSCELSHEDEEVEWSLNGTPLYNDSLHEITHEGRRHTLVLKQVQRADTGTVCASSPKVMASAHLEVKGEVSLWGLWGPLGCAPGTPRARGGSSSPQSPTPSLQGSRWCS